jgi:hypothetical protein
MGVGIKKMEFYDWLNESNYFREKINNKEKELERKSKKIKVIVKEVKELIIDDKKM